MKELKEFGPWSEQLSSTGRKYFYNKETEVSQWEKPKEWRDYELQLEQERINLEPKLTVMQPPPPPPMFMPPPPFFHPPPGFPTFPLNAPPPFHPPPPFPGGPGQFVPPMPLIPPVVPPPPRANPPIPMYKEMVQVSISSPPVPPVPTTNYSPHPQQHKPYKPHLSITNNPIEVRLDIKRSPVTPSTPTTQVAPVSIPTTPINTVPCSPIQVQIVSTQPEKEVKEEKEEAQKVIKREHEGSPTEDKQQVPKKMKDEEPEPWMRFYNADLAQKKRGELNLDIDGEMSDLVIQGLAVENKLIAELMKVKQAAAMVSVQEHEVLLCYGKITNLQEQQRIVEKRADRATPISLPDLDDLKMQFSH